MEDIVIRGSDYYWHCLRDDTVVRVGSLND